jgi:hypothetical protein
VIASIELLLLLYMCSHLPAAEAVKSSADAAAREQLAKVVEVLVADKVASFEDCIAWARLKFQVGRGGEMLDGHTFAVLCDICCCTLKRAGCHHSS